MWLWGSLNILWHCLSLGLERKLFAYHWNITKEMPGTKFLGRECLWRRKKYEEIWGERKVDEGEDDKKRMWQHNWFPARINWKTVEFFQAPLSIGFTRQEDWSGLPFSAPGDLPHPGIKLASPAQAGRFFTAEPSGKPLLHTASIICADGDLRS